MLPPDITEPAERDPKKLRRTAWILVAIMLVGGFLILKAYERTAERQAKDTHPAKIHQIRKERDLRVVRQDGKAADLFDLRGKVWVVQVDSLGDPGAAEIGRTVMKKLAEDYRENDGFRLVTLVVDPPAAEELPAMIEQTAAKEGMHLPQWWLASTDRKTLHKFIKNELKAGEFPHEKDGKWMFDSSIVLIDREGNIRRAVVPQKRGGPPFVATFDFAEAAEWDARGAKTGTERSNVEELEQLLRKTIDTLLSSPTDT
ncbi:MAG: hypothetical protein H7A49_12915 [Akkermansiaceae bacterium]|nr:hypothetical protein [Akkermansiaceae bacterium]MCP5548459.1 hypothetical protein [Akkermansiaceae bacterium]